ncbi:MAG: hypothetical protein VXY99_10150, partial [Pseudomonadota bacterium]|nr:hypothetical protein [Pseudomonadota bacterium]
VPEDCSGATHIGSRTNRIETKQKVQQRTKRSREAKRAARTEIKSQSREHDDEVLEEDAHVDMTVPKLMAMFLGNKKTKQTYPKKPLIVNDGETPDQRTLSRWASTIEQILDVILATCVDGDPLDLKAEVAK